MDGAYKAWKKAGLLLGAASVLIPATAEAQQIAQAQPTPASPDTAAIGDIIVTAQRREESLQRTPVAVTAIGSQQLRDDHIVSVADLARTTPSLSISASGSNAPTAAVPIIYIRGIGQPDPAIYSDPGVPVYVDGVYVAKSAGGAIDLPDISRVEILRGPQGTLFGKNAIGGAINVVTATPGVAPETRLELTGGNYSLYEFRGFTNFAPSDTLGISLAADAKHENGYGDRLDTAGDKIGRMGDQRHLSGRAKLRWKPTDRLTVDLAADYTRYHDTATPGQTTIVSSAILNLWNANVGSKLGTIVSQSVAASGSYDNYSENPQPAHDQIYGFSGTLGYDLGGGFALKSITAYRHFTESFTRDADGSPAVYLEVSRASRSRQFTQEVQLSGKLFDDKLDFIAGGFYLHENAIENNTATIVPGLYRALHVPNFDIGRRYNDTQITDSYAAFAQANYHFSSRLSLTAGLRYTEDHKDATVFVDSPESGITYVPTTPLADHWHALTPRLSLNYQVASTILLYASASRGYKSGGFNERPATLSSLTEFQPETVWSYEIGAKSDLFNHHLRTNLALYRSEYNNIQLTRQILINNVIVSDVNNVAKARIQGVEAEVTVVPVRHLELTGTLGYVDDKYTKLQPGAVVSIDNKIPYVSTWNLVFSGRYRIDLADMGTLTPSVNWAYRSASYAVPNNSAVSYLPAHGLLGARIAYAPSHGAWEVSVFGTNLTNKRYLTSVGDSSGIGVVYQLLGKPREFGGTVGFHF